MCKLVLACGIPSKFKYAFFIRHGSYPKRCIKQNVEKVLNDTFNLFFETVDMLLKSSPPEGSLAYTTEH